MDEKRNFFRIRNTGSIKAKYEKQDILVIDISPSGAHFIAKDVNVKKEGVIEIFINHFQMKVNYKLLKKEGQNAIVSFQLQEEISNLLNALKKIRDTLDLNQDQILLPSVEEKNDSSSLVMPKIETFTKLNSLYAIRLYQLLWQALNPGYISISLDELRQILGIEHLKSYGKYAVLKRKIIEPIKKEINEKTDLTIIYSELIEDKKVTGLQFTIMSIIP